MKNLPAFGASELLKREREQGIKDVDPWLDAFMKAEVRKGKRETVVSNYIIKILGLDVSADHQKIWWNCEQLCAVLPGTGSLGAGCKSRSNASW